MPCKTCGKDCKCLRMMSKRSCGTRSCDSDCPCPCNTAEKNCSTSADVTPTTGGQQRQQCCETEQSDQTLCAATGGS